MSTTATTPRVASSKVTAIAPNAHTAEKADYYDIAFADGTTGILVIPKGTLAPRAGEERRYRVRLTAKGSTMIDFPLPPFMPKQDLPEPDGDRPEAVAVAPPPSIPDNQPRTGKVASIKADGDFQPRDGAKQYKYAVTMADGAKGVVWTPEPKAPLTEGQEINFTYGKVYADGSKRIDLAATGSAVDKETAIMRMGCSNTAAAILALYGKVSEMPIDELKAQHIKLAKELEAHTLRSNN